jgi:AcrR family transcriptional regulator
LSRASGATAGAASHLDAILDAAEAVVTRQGMGSLTLDAVATACGLSKPGLLHHVASKDALISAMVARHVEAWYAQFERAYLELRRAGSRAPAAQAVLATCLSEAKCWSESERSRNRVMVAALVHDERQVDPLRRVHRRVSRLVARDQLPPGAGEVMLLAVHGLWFRWIFGMDSVSKDKIRTIQRLLSSLVSVQQVRR